MTDLAMTYAIYWPAERVLKVGRAHTMSRLRLLCSTGGHVILMLRDRLASDEKAAIAAMAARFERAFGDELDSTYIIPRGRGFTECFTVTDETLADAVRTILEGTAAHGHEQGEGRPAGYLHGRDADPPAGTGEADGDRVEVAGGRPGPRDGDDVAAQVEHLAGHRGGHGGRARRAPSAPRGRRPDPALQRRDPHVLPGARLAGAFASGGVEVPCPTRTEQRRNADGIVPGWGERERGSARGLGETPRSASVAVLSRAPACRIRRGPVCAMPGCPFRVRAVARGPAFGGAR